MPIWTIVFSFGTMFGIGGSTLLKTYKTKGEDKEGNSYFTLSLLLCLLVSIILWILFIFFKKTLLIFFGAKEIEVLNGALYYSYYITLILPVFVFVNTLSAYIRNDDNPFLSGIAVIIGGVVNIFGDIFFVFDFGLGMGIKGAGLATALGQVVSV